MNSQSIHCDVIISTFLQDLVLKQGDEYESIVLKKGFRQELLLLVGEEFHWCPQENSGPMPTPQRARDENLEQGR